MWNLIVTASERTFCYEFNDSALCGKIIVFWIDLNDDDDGADPSGETCPEKKVLYKLISGLHSSISVHIASEYLLDEANNQVNPHPLNPTLALTYCILSETYLF